MKKTKVVNIRKYPRSDVYIGRPSKWGNPFIIGKDGNRKEVVKKYMNWIINGEGRYLLKDLSQLKGKILGCFCKPKLCHGDVLVKLIERRLK